MKRLTKQEEEIMTILWEQKTMFVKDIKKRLLDSSSHYNTISTIVRGLEDNGFIDLNYFITIYLCQYFTGNPIGRCTFHIQQNTNWLCLLRHALDY